MGEPADPLQTSNQKAPLVVGGLADRTSRIIGKVVEPAATRDDWRSGP